MNKYCRVPLIFTFVVSSFTVLANAQQTVATQATHYRIPAKEKIAVAFVISDDAVTIDFAGPWEVFKDVFVKDRGTTMAEQRAFRLYTVSDSRDPVTTSGGMRIIPDYTFDDAPAPAIVVGSCTAWPICKNAGVDTQDDHPERRGHVGVYRSVGARRCRSFKEPAGYHPPFVL
jgi:hypothetical protein